MKKNKIGKIIIKDSANVWPHEKMTARALAKTGDDVIFIKARNQRDIDSPDIVYRGRIWEMKSPDTSNLKAIERNLRRGKDQSRLVVLETRRIKRVPEEAIIREVKSAIKRVSEVKEVLLVGRNEKILHFFQKK